MSDTNDNNSLESAQETRFQLMATMLISGATPKQIAEQVGLSDRQVRRILDKPLFKKYLREMGEEMVSAAASVWKAAMRSRVDESLQVIDYHLKEKNLEAVKLVMKSIGIEKQAEVQQQSSAITVVLPDFNNNQPKPIEAEVSNAHPDVSEESEPTDI